MRDGFLSFGEAFQSGTVDQEDVEPIVVVVVVEGHAAASCLKEVFVFVLATVDRLCVEARLTRYVDKAHSERSAGDRRWEALWVQAGVRRCRLDAILPESGRLGILRSRQSKNIIERENQCSG